MSTPSPLRRDEPPHPPAPGNWVARELMERSLAHGRAARLLEENPDDEWDRDEAGHHRSEAAFFLTAYNAVLGFPPPE